MNDVVTPSINSTTPEAYVQFGDRYIASGNIPLAIANYQRALAINPELALAHERIGAVNQQQGNLMEAIASFSKAIAINPQSLDAHLGLGNSYQQMGWAEIAITHFQQALELFPERFLPEYHCQLGNSFMERGNIEQAIACYERAISTYPDYVDSYRAIAKIFIRRQDPEAVRSIYERAETHNSEILESRDYNALGLAWIQKFSNKIINQDPMTGDLESLNRAIACFEKAIQITPDYADAHCNIGSAFVQKGEIKNAIVAYKESIDIDPNFAQPYFNLGILLNNIGKLDEAIACFQSAIELVPNWAEAHQYLGNVLQQQQVI